MFNIGCITSDSVAEVLKLTSRTLPVNTWNSGSGQWREVEVGFSTNGQLFATGFVNIAGEWLAPLRAGAGTDYEIRFTNQNSAASNIYSSTPRNTWAYLSGYHVISTIGPIGEDGVIRVEIRKASDHSKAVTAYFTFQ